MTAIIAGSNSRKLASSIARLSGARIVTKTVKRFPDGECYVRLDGAAFSGENVFVVQSLYPRQDEQFMELFLTIDAVRENGGRPVAVLPYFAYGRQDKVFEKGEPLSLRVIGLALGALGTKGLITVDAHFHRGAGKFDFYGIHAINVSAASLLRDHAKKIIRGEFAVAGPDKGSADFLKGMEGALFLSKEKTFSETGKTRSYEIRTDAPPALKGMNVLVLDDMVTSGGTMEESAKALKKQGNRVYAGCVHGVFLGGALQRLRKGTDGVFCTDTIESDASAVSVAPLIADAIKKMVRPSRPA